MNGTLIDLLSLERLLRGDLAYFAVVYFVVAFLSLTVFLLKLEHSTERVSTRWSGLAWWEKLIYCFWAAVYAVAIGLVIYLGLYTYSQSEQPQIAIPTLYKAVAALMNIFLVYALYSLNLESIKTICPGTNQIEGRLRASVSLVSIHLAFAYLSGIGGIAWVTVLWLTYNDGGSWPTISFSVIMTYMIVSLALIFHASIRPRRLINEFVKYEAYVCLMDPSLGSPRRYDESTNSLVPYTTTRGPGFEATFFSWIKPDTIANPLSLYRIILSALSLAVALLPI